MFVLNCFPTIVHREPSALITDWFVGAVLLRELLGIWVPLTMNLLERVVPKRQVLFLR